MGRDVHIQANRGNRMTQCPECQGTKEYRGLMVVEPCWLCGGEGSVSDEQLCELYDIPEAEVQAVTSERKSFHFFVDRLDQVRSDRNIQFEKLDIGGIAEHHVRLSGVPQELPDEAYQQSIGNPILAVFDFGLTKQQIIECRLLSFKSHGETCDCEFEWESPRKDQPDA